MFNIPLPLAQPNQFYIWNDNKRDVAISGSCSKFSGYEQYFDIVRLEIIPLENNWYEARLYLVNIPKTLRVNVARKNVPDYQWNIYFDIDRDGNADYSVSVIHVTQKTEEENADIWKESWVDVWKFEGNYSYTISNAKLHINWEKKYISLIFKLPVNLTGNIMVFTYLNAEKYSCSIDDFLEGNIIARQGRSKLRKGKIEGRDPEGDVYVKGDCEAYNIDLSWYDILRGEAYSDGHKLTLRLWLKKLLVTVPLNLNKKGYTDHMIYIYLDMDGNLSTGFYGYEYVVSLHHISNGKIFKGDFWYWSGDPKIEVFEKETGNHTYWSEDKEAVVELKDFDKSLGIIEITIESPPQYTILPARIKFVAQLNADRSDLGFPPCYVIDDLELTSQSSKKGKTETPMIGSKLKLSWINKYILSNSPFGRKRIYTLYAWDILHDPILRNIDNILFLVPADQTLTLNLIGELEDYFFNPLPNRTVKILIDNKLISSVTTLPISSKHLIYNINTTVTLRLSSGLHTIKLIFEGDKKYQPSEAEYTILAYRNVGFNITRDAYSFKNWIFTLKEFQKLLEHDLIEMECKNLISPFKGSNPSIMLYPLYAILSTGGHCFGMATSSAVYYLYPFLKPRPIMVYKMSMEDPLVVQYIDWYHFMQIFYGGKEKEVKNAIKIIKSLIDNGTPVVIGYYWRNKTETLGHAVTVIGYYEEQDGLLLFVYDNNMPNTIVTYKVKNGSLEFDGSYLGFNNDGKNYFIKKIIVVDPRTLYPPPSTNIICANLLKFIKRFFKKFSAIIIRSPVNVKIVSKNGNLLLIENNRVVRNDFGESYVYVTNEYKIIDLPSNTSYEIELIGTDKGEVHLQTVYMSAEKIKVNAFPTISISRGSKLLLDSLQSKVVKVDLEGDGIIDKEVTTKNETKYMPSPNLTPSLPRYTPPKKTEFKVKAMILILVITAETIVIILAIALILTKKRKK